MSVYGPNTPGDLNGAQESGWDWTSPLDAAFEDTTYAFNDVAAGPTSPLRAFQWGFSFPPGATIVGVKVDVLRYADIFESFIDLDVDGGVALVDNIDDSVHYGNYQRPLEFWDISPEWATYGGATDLWGLTSSELVDFFALSSFGVQIRADNVNAGTFAYVDAIQMTVYTADAAPAVSLPPPPSFAHVRFNG